MIANPEESTQDPTIQLDLFERIPLRPYCTDDLLTGLKIRGAKQAARCLYIQVNPPWLRAFIVMDVDRPGGGLDWLGILPTPEWSSVNMINGHAHIAWALDAPVLLGQHDKQKPMRYLAAVESAMTTKIDADPAYSGLITKNPLHKHWRTYVSPYRQPTTLGELGSYLDLKKHAPRKKPELVGLGRNVDTFDHLRHRAYKEVRGWKKASGPGAFIYWQKHLYDLALDYTGMEHPQPLDFREAHHIAKSVARWVWNKFDIGASDARFSALQAHRGKKSGAVRREATEQARATARLMAARGDSTRQIAATLGVHQSTAVRWLR